MQSAKIIWVQDEVDGPVTGMCLYNGEKCWFRRLDTDPTGNLYGIYSLTEEQVRLLDEAHVELCKTLGRPLLHGDPYVIQTSMGPDSKNTKTHEYQFDTLAEIGNRIGEIESGDFENYYVPRIIKN